MEALLSLLCKFETQQGYSCFGVNVIGEYFFMCVHSTPDDMKEVGVNNMSAHALDGLSK